MEGNTFPNNGFALQQKKLSLKKANRYYLSQGFNPDGYSSNDCGPTSLAMVMNIIGSVFERTPLTMTKEQVAKVFPSIGRIPRWVPIIGGASAPWGMIATFNYLTNRLGMKWQAMRISHASSDDISNNLMHGHLLSMLRFWEGGGAHWTNVVEFIPEEDRIYMLDPSPYLAQMPASKKVQCVSWRACYQDWTRQPWWGKILGLKRELIVYRRMVH